MCGQKNNWLDNVLLTVTYCRSISCIVLYISRGTVTYHERGLEHHDRVDDYPDSLDLALEMNLSNMAADGRCPVSL